MKLLGILLLAVAAGYSHAAAANETVNDTSACLARSASSADRADLVKWIFIAMSRHPEIRSLSASTPEQNEAAIRRAGELFTRLIADDCAAQIRAMIAANGEQSLALAFEMLGRVAMQDLMSHPDVQAVFMGLDRYADQDRVDRVLQGGK